MVVVARAVAPSVAGDFAIIVVLLPLVDVLSSGGLVQVLSRRLAADGASVAARPHVARVLAFRALVGTLLWLAWPVVARGLGVPDHLDSFVRVSSYAWPLQALDLDWLFVALGRMDLSALGRALSALVRLGLVWQAAAEGSDGALLPAAVAASVMVGVLAMWALALLDGALLFAFRSDAASPSRWIDAREAMHFLAGDLAVYGFTQADRFVIYALGGAEVTGVYHAAQRLVNPFYSISAVVTSAMYRRLAVASSEAGAELRRCLTEYFHWMLVGTIPLGGFTLLFAGTVVRTVYGPAYAAAAPILAVFGLVIAFGYTNGVLVLPLRPWGRSAAFSRAVTAAGAVDLLLCVVLVPLLGGLGGAVAALGGKVTATLVGIVEFRRVVSYPWAKAFARPILATAAATLVASALRHTTGDGAAMVAFAAAYAVTEQLLGRWQALRIA